MKPGTQIIYVPTHTNGDLNHPDCQAGFVTSIRNDVAFCRYWSKFSPGELRTKANSEGTPIDLLKEIDTVPQKWVDDLLAKILSPLPFDDLDEDDYFPEVDEVWKDV